MEEITEEFEKISAAAESVGHAAAIDILRLDILDTEAKRVFAMHRAAEAIMTHIGYSLQATMLKEAIQTSLESSSKNNL